MMMIVKNQEEASLKAVQNAAWFKRPFITFTDTSGNYRVETFHAFAKTKGMEPITPDFIFMPDGSYFRRWFPGGVD